MQLAPLTTQKVLQSFCIFESYLLYLMVLPTRTILQKITVKIKAVSETRYYIT